MADTQGSDVIKTQTKKLSQSVRTTTRKLNCVLKLSIPRTYYCNMYYHRLVNRIKIKYLENFTGVPTCFGVLNTPSLGEHTEHWTLKSTTQAQLLQLLKHHSMTHNTDITYQYTAS
jgi:hypothetical protein